MARAPSRFELSLYRVSRSLDHWASRHVYLTRLLTDVVVSASLLALWILVFFLIGRG